MREISPVELMFNVVIAVNRYTKNKMDSASKIKTAGVVLRLMARRSKKMQANASGQWNLGIAGYKSSPVSPFSQ
jgi:hypothetical protein